MRAGLIVIPVIFVINRSYNTVSSRFARIIIGCLPFDLRNIVKIIGKTDKRHVDIALGANGFIK